MKRLLSWLLALVMIISCLPMSAIPAFAAEEDTDPTLDVGVTETTHDWEVDVDEFIEYIDLTVYVTNPGDSFNYSVAAGETVYFQAPMQMAGTVVYVDGVAYTTLTTGDDMTCKFELTNETNEDATYTISVNYPEGFWDNRVVVESVMDGFDKEVTIPAGQQASGDYYYLEYTAEEDGFLNFGAYGGYDVYEGEEWTGYVEYNTDILVNDEYVGTGYAENFAVTKGQALVIHLIVPSDTAENSFPGCKNLMFTISFTYPEGHVNNPIDPWNWTTSAEVTVPAGETLYYTVWENMTLTVNGEVVEHEGGVFSITNDGAEDATYELEMIYPTGHSLNPEVIEDADFNVSGITVDDDMYYNYIWTATEEGTLTLDVNAEANIYVTKIPADGSDEVEYVLATADIVYAENGYDIESITWNIEENLAIDVVADDVLKIQVVGIDPESEWIVGDVAYNLTGSFAPAIVENEYAADLAETQEATSAANEINTYVYNVVADGTVTVVANGENVTVNGTTVSDTYEVVAGDTLTVVVSAGSSATITFTAEPEVDLSQYMITMVQVDLSTEAELQFRYWLNIPEEILNDDESYILLTKDGRAGEVEYKYTMAELRENGKKIGTSYVVHAGINANEMQRGVTINAYYNGDQAYHFCSKKGTDIGTTFTYSAVDYAHMVLPSAEEKQKNLIVAILTYGGYAQMFFGVDTDKPAYNELARYGIEIPDVSAVTTDMLMPYAPTQSGQGASFINFENVLDAAVYQRCDFTLASGVSVEDCTFTLQGVDELGESFTKTLDPTLLSGNTFRVLVENIPACYWDQAYTITVTNNKTGNSYVVTTSILAYVMVILRKSSNYTPENVALAQSIYLYNQAANAYYGR